MLRSSNTAPTWTVSYFFRTRNPSKQICADHEHSCRTDRIFLRHRTFARSRRCGACGPVLQSTCSNPKNDRHATRSETSRTHRRIDASDVVQEAFIEASRRLPEYLDAPKVSPYMWLRQIGRQVLAVHYREHVGTAGRTVHREAEPGKCPIVNSESVAGQMAASVASPHSVIAKAELLQKILILIESMAPEDREVLSLKQFEQLTFQEVALELNVSMEAAKKRYQRAVIRLGQIAAHLKGSS
jgi:RNA polymerase sigma-70 factor, ECF subfamily